FSVQFFDSVTFRSRSLVEPSTPRGKNRPKRARASISHVPTTNLHHFAKTSRHTTPGHLRRTRADDSLRILVPPRGQQRHGKPNQTVFILHHLWSLWPSIDTLTLRNSRFHCTSFSTQGKNSSFRQIPVIRNPVNTDNKAHILHWADHRNAVQVMILSRPLVPLPLQPYAPFFFP